jgi:hypothetical protein
MIKHILTVGDSFTYGEELSNLDLAWPRVLGSKCKSCVTNLGQPASSNDKIVRKTIERLINPLEDSIDLVVIGWSSPGRAEFADDVGAYDVWPGYSGNLFVKDNARWRQELCNYVSKFHSMIYYYQKYLQQVILLQNFLENQNIKYVMLDTLQNDYYKQKFFDELPFYLDKINTDTFIDFGKAGMIEWAHECTFGPNGHFLEDGHQLVAEKIYEHIRNLGWIS